MTTPTAANAAVYTAVNRPATRQADDKPWWRHPMVWLVIGGPLVVVVASLATAVVAWHGADEVLVDTSSARHVPVVRPTSETPAMQARNHAATAAPR